jgi:hypothetical protein
MFITLQLLSFMHPVICVAQVECIMNASAPIQTDVMSMLDMILFLLRQMQTSKEWLA